MLNQTEREVLIELLKQMNPNQIELLKLVCSLNHEQIVKLSSLIEEKNKPIDAPICLSHR
jgi:hypothetical protein